MFDWKRFWSFLLFFGGCIGILVALVAAAVSENWFILLWFIPATVCASAGLAILD